MTLSRSFLAKTFLNSVVLCNSELLAANSALCGNVRLEVFESSTVRPFLAAVCLQRALIRLGDAGGRDAVRLHCKERARSSAPDVFRRLLLCVFQHAIVRGCAALSWCWARADDPVGCRHACFPRYYTTLDTLASQLVRRGPKQRMVRLSRVAVMQSSTTTASHPSTHPTTVASDKRAARTRDAIRNGAWPGDSHWQCLLLTRCVLSNSCPGVLSARQGDILEYL